MTDSGSFHAVAWLAWAVGAAAAVQLAPSPLYVALVVAVAVVVVEAHGRATPLRRAFPLLIGLGVAFGLIRVLLTVLTTHGSGPVAVVLPEATLPRILGGFTVGGSLDWPILLGAAAEAFAVVGIMAAFGAFNAVAAHDELVRSAPRAFHEPGVVVTVALAFVPATIAAVGAVRQADRARTGGRIVRRGRLLRLVVPVLESGLERALALAESMDSRGFARLQAGPTERAAGWLGLGALCGVGAAFVALVARRDTLAIVLGLGGLAALVAAVALASAGRRVTRYRPRRFTGHDFTVVLCALAAPVGLAILGATGDDSLRWSPEPLAAPGFSLAAAAVIAVLAVPAVLGRQP